MAQRLILHVGLMKSGTSFIQQVLRMNHALLRERGVLFPSPWGRQVRAVRDVIGNGGSGQEPLAPDGAWLGLMRALDAWSGTAVLSMEFLGPRRLAKVRDIVASLPSEDVQVVISVRDLARTIPAMWQENVQNWGHLSWEQYLTGVEAEDRSSPGSGQSFWHRQDASGITRRWMSAVGRDHLSVLTVPPRGAPSDLLWRRFASVMQVDPEGFDLDVPSNPSLGLPSVLVLHEVNARLRASREPISTKQYERTVKTLLAKRGLAARSGEARLGYDSDWVMKRGDREIELLRALNPRVVGDLEELRCTPVTGVDPASVSTEDRLDAALDAITLLAERLARHRVRES